MSKTKTWMPLFVADYIADTTHLSTSQHGAYLLLLICQWRTGPLLDNDEQLARICRASLDEWVDDIAPTVRPLFMVLEDGRLSQGRLATEKEKAERLSKKRAEVGKSGGAAKQRNAANLAIATGLLPDLVEQTALQDPTPSPSQVQEERKSGELRSLVEIPLSAAKSDPLKIVKQATDVWNEICGQRLGRVLRITNGRKAAFMNRFATELGGDMETWRRLCERIVASPFLTNANGSNENGWTADFDFVLTEKRMVKIREGGYDKRDRSPVKVDKDGWKNRWVEDLLDQNESEAATGIVIEGVSGQ